ncbi:uncharacterized protein TRIVIDRAFT_224726 [Trichoderma virens Gv29-8]|uniref:Uncharacterized protein n=1 Tax=Hypocrea virens (strain Gv29-8 / FGSC 10586) TaxID=413071 RepID=G9N163_HYPVG|nr:uncharacterized protein TRIVIDRAFT_224726 [Trichoderma virens Gv29-8]EHK19496.1 hypothetical protein TRIVIDRAFT_224726 [Trichoderma virens Gv29-8]UKZ58246.1 hypothetical protein TrVGV298_012113 [Trichoderma virens]
MRELKIYQPNSFVFPSAKVFTYKDPFFSKHQDLITNITGLQHSVMQEISLLQRSFRTVDNFRNLSSLQDLTNQFSKLGVVEILKKLMAILVDGVLSSIEVVVDTVLNVLHDLAQSAIGILDCKIHIPIISGILNFIGVPDLSHSSIWLLGLAPQHPPSSIRLSKAMPPSLEMIAPSSPLSLPEVGTTWLSFLANGA